MNFKLVVNFSLVVKCIIFKMLMCDPSICQIIGRNSLYSILLIFEYFIADCKCMLMNCILDF